MSQSNSPSSGSYLLKSIPQWRIATIVMVFIFFGLSVHWSYIDNSPPAWDQGLYLYQSTILHNTLIQNGFSDFLTATFNLDRGRVPFLLVMVQPAFYFFGPSLDSAVISLNFFWFLLAWSLVGITRTIANSRTNDKAGFFALVLFGLYPLTTMASHNFLVEFPLISFVCAAIYSLWLSYKTQSKIWSVISGIFIGLGLLTKVTFPAFVLPAFIILAYRNIRHSSTRNTLTLFLPTTLLSVIIAGPYYFYNFKQIFEMTTLLSSHSIAQLYGFGNVFDIHTILQYLYSVFINPAMVIAILCLAIALILGFAQSHEKYETIFKNAHLRTLIYVMLAWFAIPLLLATFGEIKDTRYIYPGLVPIFILAGIAVSRFFNGKLAYLLLFVAFMIPCSGYFYSNNLLSEKSVNKFRSIFQINSIATTDAEAPADLRDWKIKELVFKINQNLDENQTNKTIFFLGGNRYYHLNLLNYFGLVNGFHLTYIVLPYYSNQSMSVDEALKFIENKSIAGIIYKSGENWPAFSSRLDSEIISQLKTDPKYKTVDLGIEQPDGSRFTLFIQSTPNYTSINSISDLVGNWKAGDGLANIALDNNTAILTNENGSREFAKIQNGNITVPGWNVTGKLTVDSQYIHWSNGFIWERLSNTKHP